MVLSLIEKIKQIKSFDLCNDKLYYVTSEMDVSGIEAIDIKKIGTKYPGEIFTLSSFLIWQDGRGKSVVYDLTESSLVFSNSSENEKYTFRRIDLVEKGLLIVSRRLEGKKQTCLFRLKDRTFDQINFNITASVNGLHALDVDADFQEIRLVDLDGHIIWNYNITGEYFDLRKEEHKTNLVNIIGTYNDKLLLGLSSGEIEEINIGTGSLIKRLSSNGIDSSGFPFQIIKGDYIPFGELMQLDENKGEIIGLRDKYFFSIDLKELNPTRKYINVGKSMDAFNITSSYRNHTFPCDKQFIYFCDDRQGKIGVFDRDKKEVVCSYELEMQKDGIAQILEMKYSNNRLYVLDRNNNLHIFEKE